MSNTAGDKGPICEDCCGSGRVAVGRWGSRPPRKDCPKCEGTGVSAWVHSLPDGDKTRYWIESDDNVRPEGYDDIDAVIDAAKVLRYEPLMDRENEHHSVYLAGVPDRFIGTTELPPRGTFVLDEDKARAALAT